MKTESPPITHSFLKDTWPGNYRLTCIRCLTGQTQRCSRFRVVRQLSIDSWRLLLDIPKGNIEVRLTDLDAKNQHLFINDPKDAYSSPVTIVEQLEVVKTFCL